MIKGCPKCAPGLVVSEEAFKTPLLAHLTAYTSDAIHASFRKGYDLAFTKYGDGKYIPIAVRTLLEELTTDTTQDRAERIGLILAMYPESKPEPVTQTVDLVDRSNEFSSHSPTQ